MPFNSIFSWIIKKRIHQIDLFRLYPVEVQHEWMTRLVAEGSNTAFGKKYHFDTIENYDQFKLAIPLQNYDSLKPWIERCMAGEQRILWNTDIKWFAKSSGTTSDRSKLIPVSTESIEECHYKGGKDLLALYYTNYPNRKLYNGKHLIIGGSATINNLSEDSYFGDLSAIIVQNLPWWAELRRTPAKEIALMSEWEEKIERMAQSTIHEDVYILAGVPSWTMVLCQRVLEITGKESLKEVWPNLELFMHGGVSFEPYRLAFDQMIGDSEMHYVETYNASEGFFGIQDDPSKDSMLLMLDYGIFYEFIPMHAFDELNSTEVVSISEVELGVNYAVVITTNGGLWRYILGDTIEFTEKSPYRFKITGRTKSYINTFGEEVIVNNAEQAIARASAATNAQIRDFHACPSYMTSIEVGSHEWIIEFVKEPDEWERFCRILDETLREINSDYDAKRYKNMILKQPQIRKCPPGTFDNWLKQQQKLGGQHKIPRLANNRTIMEQLLKQLEDKIHAHA